MSNTIIRNANISDIPSIKNLYLNSAEYYPDNLILTVEEITDDYILNSLYFLVIVLHQIELPSI